MGKKQIIKAETLKNQVCRIPCPVCSSNNSVYWKTVKDWTIEKCKKCSMIFVNPCPTEEAIEKAYSLPKKEYDKFFQSEYIDSEKILGGTAKWQYDISVVYLENIEKKLGRKGRILEIGCGSGIFLEVAQEKGWETAGVDIGDWRNNSEKNAKLNILQSSLFNADFDDASFDAVFMGSVLEHLQRPDRYLKKIFELLKREGVLYITGIPNIKSWTIQLGIDKWIGNHPPLHLLYFSKKTLDIFFKKNSYTNITIRSYGISETILEIFFNQGENKYSGSYAELVFEKSFRGYMINTVRWLLYFFCNITKTGSVLEIMAKKY